MKTISLEAEALAWLRYTKFCDIVCTEGPRWNSDVIGITPKLWIEVEVKRSISDLKADFRKVKHELYADVVKSDTKRYQGNWPNYFYFFLESDMGEKALPIIEECAPYAGIALRRFPATDTYRSGRDIQILKKPQKIHNGAPLQSFVKQAMSRAASELAALYMSLDLLRVGEGKPDVEAIQAHLASLEGTLDSDSEGEVLEWKARELCKFASPTPWEQLSDIDKAQWVLKAQVVYNMKRGLLEEERKAD